MKRAEKNLKIYMGLIIFLAASILIGGGNQTVNKDRDNDNITKIDDRFAEIYKQEDGRTIYRIILDTETDLKYLEVQNNGNITLTPLKED